MVIMSYILTGGPMIHVGVLMQSIYIIPNARLIRTCTCMQPFSKRPQAKFVYVYMCILWGCILVTA